MFFVGEFVEFDFGYDLIGWFGDYVDVLVVMFIFEEFKCFIFGC